MNDGGVLKMKIRSFFKENDYVVLSFLICFFGGYFLMSAKINAEESWENYNKGIKLVKLAEKGDAEALYQLSYVYEYGDEVVQDPKKSLFWMRKVAEQGYPLTQYETGFKYFGEEHGRNYKEAYKWFRIAVLSGHDLRYDGTNSSSSFIKMAKGHLSLGEISEAEKLAREWMDRNKK